MARSASRAPGLRVAKVRGRRARDRPSNGGMAGGASWKGHCVVRAVWRARQAIVRIAPPEVKYKYRIGTGNRSAAPVPIGLNMRFFRDPEGGALICPSARRPSESA